MAPRAGAGSSNRKRSASPPPGGAADLELTDDQRYSLTEQHRQKYEKLIIAKKAANKAVLDFGKIIKADLGEEGLADIKGLIDLATPEGEARVKAEVERTMRLLRWMQVPIGTNGDLFPKTDRTPGVDRARAEGKRQGLAGETNSNPHHQSTDAYRAHNEGYAEGQDILAKGFKPMADKPQGSMPRDEWQKTMAENNKKVEDDIKSAAKLGSARKTYEMN